ncbi:MAG: PPK2 family polyphosphate kinase [Thermomicrobiales bacterium]
MGYVVQVPPGKAAKLRNIPTDDAGELDHETANAKFDELAAELGELQELLYGAKTHALLIVLQGLDTSGKDGAIRGVFKDVSPEGCVVTQFKTPTEEDLGHDFLWRVHPHTPARGMIGVFNRSHYEDVLIVRVNKLAPPGVWRERFAQINDFERLLETNKTIIAKYYLHISEREQKERLLARERDVEKAWKLSAQDWIERRSWNAYWDAYDDALTKCNSDYAPWRIVPADHKWFRNLAIAEDLVNLLRPYKKAWLETLSEQGMRELAAIKKAREAGKISI